MKKIIMALDGAHFPQAAFEFACYLNDQHEILLAGIFLSPVDYAQLLSYPAGAEAAALLPGWFTKNDDDTIIHKNIQAFQQSCEAQGLHYRVHNDSSITALAPLLEETRFADLLLISTGLFYKNIIGDQPNYYLEEVLKRSACPVMLIPENYKAPSKILLNYDGEDNALFAIKQFAYLFPEFTTLQTTVISVNSVEPEARDEYSMLTELLSGHYPNLELQNVNISNNNLFVAWLSEQSNSYLVLGSFSRSFFSEIFKQSFATNIIREIKMPLFITHK